MAKVCGSLLFGALVLAILKTSASEGQQKKIRQKREWIIPPHKLKENVDYTNREFIAKIRSDEETRTSIQYSLTGIGADKPPINLFTVNSETGVVRIHGVLDREKTPVYYLQGVAKFLDGSYAENNIDLRIVVEDENDCAPVFNLTMGAVYERSATGHFVMTVTATDADQEGTLHTKIAYSIMEPNPGNMFFINRETGGIHVQHNMLDREKQERYTLIIIGADMGGNKGGKTGTGTAIINILDVNDNIPTLEKNSYECRVEENTRNVEVMRFQAIDADLIYTENWLAIFTIVSGNEAGYFSIITDNKTNEGILILHKELDYEELKEIKLQVSVANKAQYHSSVVITESKTYTIHVSVVNQPEGPRFKPTVKVITISEESTTTILQKIITNYAAIDSDTLLIATNVRYAKGKDVDNWLIIDERTADIRLNKIPDYESRFLINGTYYAEIICITNDVPAKTATGTIAIQVKDFNDHCPVLIRQSQTLCFEDHVIYVTAVDRDQFPNGAPFGFKVDTTSTKESWSIEPLNDTTAIFRSQKTLWPGMYHVFVDVWDQQGNICAGQELQIDVCKCNAAKVCLPKKIVSTFTASGVLLMLLGLLLLLLVPLLLLFCLCGGAGAAGDFKTMPFDTREHLITYNTEGQGDDQEMALLKISKEVEEHNRGNVGAVGGAQTWGGVKDGGCGAEGSHWTSFYDQRDSAYHHQTDGRYVCGIRKEEHSRFEDYMFDGLALSDGFLGNYYSQKVSNLTKKQDTGDSLKIYNYEGQESYKGSFEDICDLLHEDNDLAFLDDLDLNFRTLAEICRGSKIETKISTNVPVTSKPVFPTTHKDVNIQESVSNLQSQEKATSSAIIHTSGAQQTSSMSSTGVYVQDKVVVPNQTLLVQQPAFYYAPASPIYVMEAQPTLLVTSGPVLGLQENLLMEEKKGSGASAKRETQHYQSVVLVEKQPPKVALQTQGAMHMVNTEIMQSMEAQGVKRALHPSTHMVNTEIMQSMEAQGVKRAMHPSTQMVNTEIMQSMEAQGVKRAMHPSTQMVNTEIMQSMEAQGVKRAMHPSTQMVNTEIMQSTEVHEVRRAVHPGRRVMAGAGRETDVYASLEMRVPQSL
ncbi:desmoglein-2-like protein isoform X3 [Carassius auratus]|uniref:Desmoglein-2-like isoform X2 n=1 Tax=Carassius auratus TaxID=7957 RepID=A0A6P6JSG3_CARAU|nr:desmoglein-2-like isoform X2 [Carassius auratus]XP_026062832.1 desmoglein-2-like isoform X3 [Carassius auratus]